MLIALESINYSVAGVQLLNDVTLVINPDNRIALIGRNGCGKSTLMNILAGQIDVDAGKRVVTKNTSMLLVKQALPNGDISPIDFLKESDAELVALYERLDAADGEEITALSEEIAMIEEERYEKRAEQVLFGLGISVEQQARPMKELSGGLMMRISLASALIQEPDVLFLDEPTNHLDLPAVAWLTQYLKTYPKPFVLISHDRQLLDTVINTTYHLKQGRLTQYSGNFTTYLEQRELLQKQALATTENMDKKIANIDKFVAGHKSDPKWAGICSTREKWKREMEEQRPELDHEAPPIPIEFLPCDPLSDPIIQAENCIAAYGSTPVLTDVNVSIQSRSRIGILGMNGQGKSTLMRLLMQQMVTTTGDFFAASRLRIGYFSQNQADIMRDELTVIEQLQSTLTSSMATEDMLSHLLKFGFKRAQCTERVSTLSGGEKSRLAFAMIAILRPNLIIMDEPTNHLDFETRMSLIQAINQFNGAVVLVSHDWDLLEKTMQQYWLVRDKQVKVYTHDLSFYQKAILNRLSSKPTSDIAKAPISVNAKQDTSTHTKQQASAYSSGSLSPLFAATARQDNNKKNGKGNSTVGQKSSAGSKSIAELRL